MVSLGMRDADLVLTVHFSAFFIPGACRDTIILWYLIALVTFGLEIAERQNRLDKIGRGKNLSDQQAESPIQNSSVHAYNHISACNIGMQDDQI